MTKQFKNELMELDLYEILGTTIDATEKEIRQLFRKKALKCHPDKNPDNPNAAEEFNKLKAILEILLDSGAKTAYDKILKGRKAATVRARQANAKSQKLQADLELREKTFAKGPQISEKERLLRELKRLEDEGKKLIEDEINQLNFEAKSQATQQRIPKETKPEESNPSECRVKARWFSNEDWNGFTKEEIERIFYKWGEINAVVMKQKGNKNTALIEYKNKNAAEMAIQFEKGLPEKLLEVTTSQERRKKSKKSTDRERSSNLNSENGKCSGKFVQPSKYDFESVAQMNMRRAEERKKLIEQMKNDPL